MKEKKYFYASVENNINIKEVFDKIDANKKRYDSFSKCILYKVPELMDEEGIKPTVGILTDAESEKKEYTIIERVDNQFSKLNCNLYIYCILEKWDREKLKEVQNKRDKAKLAGVKERIAAETAHIHKENEALKNQVKDAFAQENIPMFCNSRIYIALYRTKRMTDVLIYLLCIALVYAAVPFLLSVIPQFPLWGMILYYVVVILIQSFTNKMIVEKTLVRHAETIDMAKKLKEQIRSNHKKMKKIAKNIKTDSNEEMYGLHEFDDKMNEIREDMKRIEQEKEKALEDFEMTVKPDIIAEIEGRENERINAMKAELDKKSAENLKLENLIKEQRIYISSNYEAYLGKEYVTVEKLTELKQVMISGGAATVAQALAVYREKHL